MVYCTALQLITITILIFCLSILQIVTLTIKIAFLVRKQNIFFFFSELKKGTQNYKNHVTCSQNNDNQDLNGNFSKYFFNNCHYKIFGLFHKPMYAKTVVKSFFFFLAKYKFFLILYIQSTMYVCCPDARVPHIFCLRTKYKEKTGFQIWQAFGM